MLFVIGPMLILGTLYWFGRPQPRRAAYLLAVGFPILTLVVCGVEPVLRIAGRVDDGNLQSRLVEGNGSRLVWAAEGIGWPREERYLARGSQTLPDTFRKMGGTLAEAHRMYGACRQWKKRCARCRVTASTAADSGKGQPKRRLSSSP